MNCLKNRQFKLNVLARYALAMDLEGLTLERYMKAHKVSLNDFMMQWGLDEEDLRRRYEIEEDEESFDEVTEEIYRRFKAEVRDRFDDWLSKYERLNYPLTLYRAICVPKLEDINLKKLGTDWSDKEESADCYHKHLAKPDSKTFIVKALVGKKSIDWLGTIWNNLNESFGDHEQEINLIPKTRVKVVEILTPDDTWTKINKTGTI